LLTQSSISNLHEHGMPTPNDHGPPSYETQQSPIRGPEHQRSLERGKNQKWLSLFVRGGSKDAASMPIFSENDDILGRVEIDLDKAESVKSITITVSSDLPLASNLFLSS
jgi:hypothetical protein